MGGSSPNTSATTVDTFHVLETARTHANVLSATSTVRTTKTSWGEGQASFAEFGNPVQYVLQTFATHLRIYAQDDFATIIDQA